MAIQGAQWVAAATATSLTTALGLTTPVLVTRAIITNKTGAANILYVGGSDVANTPANAWLEIAAAATKEFGEPDQHFSSDNVYLVGTVNAANVAFILVIT